MKVAPLKTGNKVIVPNCFKAKSFVSRFMGLMGRKQIDPNEAVLFPKCNSIHTFFMRFPIDVIMISDEGVIIEIKETTPWRMLLPRKGVKHVIE